MNSHGLALGAVLGKSCPCCACWCMHAEARKTFGRSLRAEHPIRSVIRLSYQKAQKKEQLHIARLYVTRLSIYLLVLVTIPNTYYLLVINPSPAASEMGQNEVLCRGANS